MKGITRDCVVEMFARKTIYLFAAVTLVAVLLGLLTVNVDLHFEVTGTAERGAIAGFLQNPVTHVLGMFMSFLVFLAVLATAGLVPTMLVKGRAEFFLSKPISRTSLLLNRLFAVWAVYGLTIVVSGAVLYAVLVLIHGFFDWKVLYLFVFSLVSFFIWLSITVAAGVLFGSTVISLMCAFLVWVAQAVLKYHETVGGIVGSRLVSQLATVLYYVVPKTSQIGDRTTALAMGNVVVDWMPVYTSVAFALVAVLLAVLVFKRRDY